MHQEMVLHKEQWNELLQLELVVTLEFKSMTD